MTSSISLPVLQIQRLDNEPTGDCPCGCGEAAYPYSVEGLDGYVDSAPECVQTLALDALENQS